MLDLEQRLNIGLWKPQHENNVTLTITLTMGVHSIRLPNDHTQTQSNPIIFGWVSFMIESNLTQTKLIHSYTGWVMHLVWMTQYPNQNPLLYLCNEQIVLCFLFMF